MKFHNTLLLGMLLLCASLVHAQGTTFSYTPGIYDESIDVKHIVSDVVYLEIEQEAGNKAYDWLSFVPKSKTKILEDYNGSRTVALRWNIPKDADIGKYHLIIKAFDEDNRLAKTYHIELNIENKHYKKFTEFIKRDIDFGLFNITTLTLGLGALGLIVLVVLIAQIKEFFMHD